MKVLTRKTIGMADQTIPAGVVVTFPEKVARNLIRRGAAEKVESPKPESQAEKVKSPEPEKQV